MNVLIVDDSRLARLELKSQLMEIGGVSDLFEAEDIHQALNTLKSENVDLLLLDINMPGGNGFELLEQLDVCPQVIFVTAYDEFALKSFEYNALDYLVKPVTIQRLQTALEKCRSSISKTLDLDSHFFVKDGNKCHFIKLKDVQAFESLGNYCKVHLVNQSPCIYKNLTQLENKLPDDAFFRANRSWIVNIHHIADISLGSGGILDIQTSSGVQIEMSRRQASSFKQLWGL